MLCVFAMIFLLMLLNLFLQQQAKSLESYVGFANLPNQLYRKSVKQGFEFTLMVVGKHIIIMIA